MSRKVLVPLVPVVTTGADVVPAIGVVDAVLFNTRFVRSLLETVLTMSSVVTAPTVSATLLISTPVAAAPDFSAKAANLILSASASASATAASILSWIAFCLAPSQIVFWEPVSGFI